LKGDAKEENQCANPSNATISITMMRYQIVYLDFDCPSKFLKEKGRDYAPMIGNMLFVDGNRFLIILESVKFLKPNKMNQYFQQIFTQKLFPKFLKLFFSGYN